MIPHMRDPMLSYRRETRALIVHAAVGTLGVLTAALCVVGAVIVWSP